METKQMFEIVKLLFPGKTFCLQEQTWHHVPEDRPINFRVSVHSILSNKENDGIAAGSAENWADALKNLYKDIFVYENTG